MRWSKEAEVLLLKVPFFVKKRVKKRVEEETKRLGASVVTADHVNSLKNRFLNKMEDEVKGFQVETCFGSSDCPNSTTDISRLTDRIEKTLSKENMKGFLKEKVKGPLKFHHEFRASISGCPNACSRPQIADIGIISVCTPEITKENCNGCGDCKIVCKEDAISLISGIAEVDKSKCLLCGQCVKACPSGAIGEAVKGFKILIGGKLGRHPRLAMEVPGIFNLEETVNIIKRLISFYKENCLKGERFAEVLENKKLFDLSQGNEILNDIIYQ